MNKWELTRYLIDAKKCVDSVLFIAAYGDELRYIDLRKKISELRSEFSIKCCVVIDKHLERVKFRLESHLSHSEIKRTHAYTGPIQQEKRKSIFKLICDGKQELVSYW